MFNFQKLRLPYRDDTAFSLLAFCIFLVPLAFSAYSYENFESVKFSLFLIFTGAASLAFLWQLKKGKTALRHNKYFFWLLLAFLFWAALSGIFAQDHLYGVIGFYYRYTSGLLFYVTLSMFIFLLINLVDSDRFEFLLKILVVDALIVALLTFLQSFGWIFYGGLELNGFFRGPSLLGNSNYSAMFLSALLPVTLYFAIRQTSYAAKVYYSLAGIAIILANLLLASRGAMLAIIISAIAALALLAFFRFPKKFFLSLLALVLLGIAGGYFFLQVSRPQAIASIITSVDSNTISRFAAWQVSLSGVAVHPWLGVGPGNYALFFERSRGAVSNQIGVFDDAHNLFLQLAVTGGLPLLFLFLGFISTAVFQGFKQARAGKDLLSLALLSSLVAWLAGASFNPVPIPMYILLAVFLAGLLLASRSQTAVSLGGGKKYFLIFIAVVVAVCGTIDLISEHLLRFSAQAYAAGEYRRSERLAGLAYSMNPTNGQFLIYQAASQIRLGDERNAIISRIEKIKKLHPAQASSYVSASALYSALFQSGQNQTDLRSAIDNLQAALQIDPWYADRYGQLALYYYQAGDMAEAKAAVEKDLGLDGGNFSAWILLAKLYQLQGNRQKVVWALTKAFNLNPGVPQLKYLLYLAKNLKDIKQVPIEIIAR